MEQSKYQKFSKNEYEKKWSNRDRSLYVTKQNDVNKEIIYPDRNAYRRRDNRYSRCGIDS